MEIEELQALIAANNPQELIDRVKAAQEVDFNTDARLKEYEPEGHEVFDTQKRKNKEIVKPVPGPTNSDGSQPTRTDYVPVTRIAFAGQKLIVKRRVMFMTGGGVELEATPKSNKKANTAQGEVSLTDEERLYKMFQQAAGDNKLDFRYGPIAKTMLAEGECAVVFYLEDADPGYWGELGTNLTVKRPKMVQLNPSDGNTFYPVFDVFKNLVAFGRTYKVQDKEWFDLYTATELYRFVEGQLQEPAEGTTRLHGFDRIPVAYFAQERKEWQDVQGAIERLEKLLSNHGDTNDYNGSPILVATGDIKGFASKGESGKILELEPKATAQYLSWDSAPESIKLEIENLFKVIYSVSQTPDLSFEQMKGIGAISGVALRLLFLDAHAAAKEKQDGAYGESVQRLVNILKAGIVAVDKTLAKAAGLPIKVRFSTYLPSNESEELDNQYKQINNLATALAAGLISNKTAISLMPAELVNDPEEELKAVQVQLTAEKVTLQI